MNFKPFFINSNMFFGDEKHIDEFQRAVGNTGNSYITYSLVKLIYGKFNRNYLNGINNIYYYDFLKQQEKDLEYINSECSHVIFILQDQIRKPAQYGGIRLPFEKVNAFLSRITVPVVAVSLGSNSFGPVLKHTELEDELVKFLKILSEKCTMIGVRGYTTVKILNDLGIKNVIAIGCPSFFKNGKNRFIEKKEYKEDFKLAITPSYFNHNPEVKNYEMIFQDEFLALKQSGGTIFSDIEEWEQYMKKFDFSLGTRLHGAIAALNAGVPAVVMNGDNRARCTCEYLGIPYNPDLIVVKDIKRIYDWVDFSEMNKTYNEKFNKFMNYLEINGVKNV